VRRAHPAALVPLPRLPVLPAADEAVRRAEPRVRGRYWDDPVGPGVRRQRAVQH
jgi:hypothetical protein